MGCDIHFEVERRVNGVWRLVPHPERACETCAEDGAKPDCWRCYGTGKYREQFYRDRDYNVFAARGAAAFAGEPGRGCAASGSTESWARAERRYSRSEARSPPRSESAGSTASASHSSSARRTATMRTTDDNSWLWGRMK